MPYSTMELLDESTFKSLGSDFLANKVNTNVL